MNLKTRILTWLFIGLQFVSLSREFLISEFGAQWHLAGLMANLVAPPVLLLLLMVARNVDRPGWFSGLPRWALPWIGLCTIIVLAAFLNGTAFRGQFLRAAAQDLIPYFYIFGTLILGSKPRICDYVIRPLLAFFFVGILINLYAASDIGGIAQQSAAGARIARDTLSYETQSTLAAWPLLLLLVNRMKLWQAIIVFSGVVLFAGLQVLFQKRLGVGAVAILIALYVWQSVSSRYFVDRHMLKGARLYVGLFAAVIVTAMSLTFVVAPGVILEQGSSLVERLAGRDAYLGYTRGVTSIFTIENERLRIALDCFRSFSPAEWLFGRGMGGAYEWSSISANLLNSSRASDIWVQYYLEDLGYFGRRNMEIGLLMPLLKGGLLLWGTFYFGVLRVCFNRRTVVRDYTTSAFYYALVFTTIYTLQGGFFVLSESIGLIVCGLALGRCLSAEVFHRNAAAARPRPVHRLRLAAKPVTT